MLIEVDTENEFQAPTYLQYQGLTHSIQITRSLQNSLECDWQEFE